MFNEGNCVYIYFNFEMENFTCLYTFRINASKFLEICKQNGVFTFFFITITYIILNTVDFFPKGKRKTEISK